MCKLIYDKKYKFLKENESHYNNGGGTNINNTLNIVYLTDIKFAIIINFIIYIINSINNGEIDSCQIDNISSIFSIFTTSIIMVGIYFILKIFIFLS